MLSRLVLVALCISSPQAQAEDDVCTGLQASEPCPSSVLIQRNQLFQSSSQNKGINPLEDFGFPLWSSESEPHGEEKKSQAIFSEDAPAEAPKKEDQQIHSFAGHAAEGKKADGKKADDKKAGDKKADNKKTHDKKADHKKAHGKKADDMQIKERSKKELETMQEENNMFAFMKDSVQVSLLDVTTQPGAQPGAQPAAPEGTPEEQLPNEEDNKDLNVDGLKRIAATKDTDECFSFLHRLTEAMGLEPKGTKGDDFLYKLAKEYASKGKADPFDTLVRKLLDSPDLKPSIIVKDGSEAPLSQNGYRGVVQQHSDAQMQKYMQRLAESMDLKVTNKGGLAGSSAWYSGRKAVQSLAKLRAELLAESRKKNGWIKPNDKPNDKKKEESLLAVMDGVITHSQSGRKASQLNAPKREHVISSKASGTILTSKQPGNVSKSNSSAKVKATVTNASNASGTTLKKAKTNASGASGWKFNITKRKGANANKTDKNAQTDDPPDTAEEIARSLHTKNRTGSSSNASSASNHSVTSTKNSSKASAKKREGNATGARNSTKSKQAATKTAANVKVVAKVKTTSNSTNKIATATNSTTKAKVTTTSNSTNKTVTATKSTTTANKTTVNSTATKKSTAGTSPKKTTVAAKTNKTANSSATVNATASSKTASAPKAKANTTSANSSKTTANSTRAKAGNTTDAKVTTAVKKKNATSAPATKKEANATGAGKANQTTLKSNKIVTNTTVTAKKNTTVSATKKGANVTGAGKANQTTTTKSNKTVTNTTVTAKKDTTASAKKNGANATGAGKANQTTTPKSNKTATNTTAASKKNTTVSATKKGANSTGAATSNQTTTPKSNKTGTNTTVAAKKNTTVSVNKKEANATGVGNANKSTTPKSNKTAAGATAAVKTKSGNKGKENIIGHVEKPNSLTVKSDTDTATDAVPKQHQQYEFKSFSQGVYKRVAKNSNKEEMYSFINQTMTSMGLKEEKEGFLDTLAEEKSKAKDPGSFSELVAKLNDAKGKELKSTCIEKNGYMAPFSENGYRCVVQMQDDEQMLAYTKRLATEMGLDVNAEAGAQEQMPLYSGKVAVQSLAKLREQLRKVASTPNGWATRRGLTNATMAMDDSNATIVDDLEVGTPPPIAA